MSNFRNGPCHVTVFFPRSIGFVSHVNFKKRPCRPVELRGQGPHLYPRQRDSRPGTENSIEPGLCLFEHNIQRGGSFGSKTSENSETVSLY